MDIKEDQGRDSSQGEKLHFFSRLFVDSLLGAGDGWCDEGRGGGGSGLEEFVEDGVAPGFLEEEEVSFVLLLHMGGKGESKGENCR